MQYRIDKFHLLDILSIWDSYLSRKIRLIACGGTALTLLHIKESTKDVDFIVPQESEYKYLIKILIDLGYSQKTSYGWGKDKGFLFDFYWGDKVYTTGLLESPLQEGNNIVIKEFAHIYLGVLNYYDLIITKIFRSTSVDIEDCLALMREKYREIDTKKLKARYSETSSYDISHDKNIRNFKHFLDILKEEGFKI
jgi:hypothetical protein